MKPAYVGSISCYLAAGGGEVSVGGESKVLAVQDNVDIGGSGAEDYRGSYPWYSKPYGRSV